MVPATTKSSAGLLITTMNIETLQQLDLGVLVFCPACDCPESTLLGQLGNRVHVRCRGCGIDFSFRAEPEVLAS